MYLGSIQAKMNYNTQILAIGTALPPHRYQQQEIAAFMQDYLGLDAKAYQSLIRLYDATGIKTRHSVLPDFGRGTPVLFRKDHPEPLVEERMRLYRKHALPLASEASRKALKDSGVALADITHIISISCTGMYAPGLDIELVLDLGLKSSVNRSAVTFMGCYAAFNGLKLADAICRSDINANVLVVCTELCSLHFQRNASRDQIVAQSLFADGAAAVVLSANPNVNTLYSIDNFYCDLAATEEKAMAWEVGSNGFEMILSSYVPNLLEGGMAALTGGLFEKSGKTHTDIQHYAIHPGGRKILEAVEGALKLTTSQNDAAYEILQRCGNMSSPTVLFVLKELIEKFSKKDQGSNVLSAAFGPGLTLESMLLTVA
jgi:alpha-pyrone synthase